MGLIATIAALATHFVLLRAPLSTDFASWRGSAALWHFGVILVAGLGACYLAGTSRQSTVVSRQSLSRQSLV
jgi:hypothetical protein